VTTEVRHDRDTQPPRVADDAGLGRIARLPPNVVNRIAAGEVVERPASVVKELLENALDADATRIEVAVEQGGIGLVRVVDDGGGIEAEDLPLAVTAHATSKLRVAEDLERIGTLGFRGEALASIGSVARLVVRSRRRGADGAVIEVDHGHHGGITPDGGAVGTSVEVHQLFGRVPARRAFLRSPQTEWSHAAEAFVRVALAHPEVAFTLAHNGRMVHDLATNGGLPGTAGWRPRIGAIFGPAVAERLIDVDGDDGEIVVGGLVGRPDDDQASTRLQHLFVNGRPFRDRALLHAIQEAYRGLLLSGRHPIVFLRFELPPEMVDVNVHPSKMEVRFREPARLYRLVLATLRARFLAADMTTRLNVPAGRPAAGGGAEAPSLPFGHPPVGPPPVTASAGPQGPPVRPGTAVCPPAWEEADTPGAEMRAVQMHDRYIVVESPAGIEVIDQHALHERVLYERFRADVAEGGLEVQRLLVPERVELAPAELETVQRHQAALEQAGIRLEPFGGSTAIVTAKPALAGRTPAGELVREVLDRLATATAAGRDTGLLVDEVLHGLACRAAIKAGDRLSQAEVDALVRDRQLVPNTHHCPHGRPTSLTLSRQELDRQFRRT
jgi:DNA mismatch repair protein MutL